MSLVTGKQIGQPNNQFAKLPATNVIVAQVHELAGNNDTLTLLSGFFEDKDLHNGFALRVAADPDVAGVSEDEVVEEQDQA